MAKKPSLNKLGNSYSRAKRNAKSAAGLGRSSKTRRKSGNSVKVYAGRSGSSRSAKAQRKAARLSALPTSRTKRWLYKLRPSYLMAFWFSRDGAIMAMKVAGIGMAVMVVLVLALFAFYRRDLGDPRNINYGSLTTKFYDRTGQHLLYEVYGAENRVPVEFDQISNNAKWATIAVEDKDFYKHGGFSVSGIMRAALNNVLKRDNTQGGSTLTQQFIKNNFLTGERTYTRKIKELILAVELERLYTKDEILAFYLNEIPYGAQEYGIQAASQSFFKKDAKFLTIDEAAILAALPQAPSYYSPYGGNTEALVGRQHYVIDQMLGQGYITEEEANEAKEINTLAKITPSKERSLYTNIRAPHFVLEVQRQLEAKYDPQVVQTGGLKIITTLNYNMQTKAEKAVKQNMKTVLAPPSGGSGNNAALVSVDNQTGQVMALVGSRDFDYPGYGAFNAATSGRQPGSSFKPYGYAELFKNKRWGAGSAIYDTSTDFNGYRPNNFDRGFRGKMTVRTALGESRNIPAVKALYIAGVDNVIDQAKAMGVTSLGDSSAYGLSLILGSGEVKLTEHTQGYSTFARGGIYKEQAWVLKVENSDGEVLEEWQPSEGERVLDEDIAYIVTDILKDDSARVGTFGANNPDFNIPGLTTASKTGTTDEARDGWMMGYTRHYSTGVWVGNHDNLPMNSATANQTGPIWTQFMREVHKNKQNVDIFETMPDSVQRIRMDRSTGYTAGATTRDSYWDLFPSGYERQFPGDNTQQKVTIDTVSNRLATECTPDRAKKVITSGRRWPEILPDDPAFGAWSASAGYGSGGAAYTREEDNIHKCSDTLPEVSLDVSNTSGSTYRFAATVTQGTHRLTNLNFRVNGQIVSAKKINSSGTYVYFHTFTSSGNRNVSAEVVDNALYDNTDSTTVTGSSLSLSEIISGNDFATFSWSASGYSAPDLEICIISIGCEDVGSNPETFSDNDIGLGDTLIAFLRVKGSGTKSSNISFTVGP